MSFRDIEQSFFDLHWQLDPVAATQAGVPGHDDHYGRFSPAALAPHLAALKSIASALEGVNAADLEEEIDRTALLNEIRVLLRRFEKLKPQAKNPEFWLSHLLGGLHHLLLSADRTPAEKAAAAIGRLEDIPEFLDDLKASLEEPVRVFVETAMRMTEGGRLLVNELAAALGAEAPMYSARLAAAAEQASAALVAFDSNLERWLEMGTEHFAIGEDEFNFLLHYQHALRDTAPELWRYGLRLKEEIEADLVRLAANRRVVAPAPHAERAGGRLREGNGARPRFCGAAQARAHSKNAAGRDSDTGVHASGDSVCCVRQPWSL